MECFWNKVKYPNLLLEELQIGGTFEIFSRKYTCVGYGDDRTQQLFEPNQGKGFLLIKPDAYLYIGQIIDAILNEGLTITRLKMTRMDITLARNFAKVSNPSELSKSIEFLAGDVTVGIEASGQDAISVLNTLAGPMNPKKAKDMAPRSFTALYGSDSVKNAVYFSQESQDADLFFSSEYTEILDNCTWCIIKPHCFEQSTVGKIIDYILQEGFEISAMRMLNLKPNDAKEFFEFSWSKYPEYKYMLAQMEEGPWIALEIRKDNIIDEFMEFAGDVDPDEAKSSQPQSLRALFGNDIARNAVYCSNAKDEGIMESEYFFRLLED